MTLLSKTFLELWDNPGEYVQMKFDRLDYECHLTVVVSPPSLPQLEFPITPTIVGAA